MAEVPIMTEPFNNLAFPFDRSGAGFKYLLTCISLASRFPEAIPLKTMTATEVADGILEVFSRHGVPSTLLSDQGTPFVCAVADKICEGLGIQKIKTTPYHP